MPQQDRYRLIFECIQERTYQPGQLVVLQSKRSHLNTFYRPFYENRASKFRQEIEHKIVEFEMMTGKKHTEIGSLMMVMRQSAIHYGNQEDESSPGSKKDDDNLSNEVVKKPQIPSCKRLATMV